MNPAAQLSVSLLAGLVLWLPTLSATMRGDTELPEAAVRYLVAFLLARVAIAGIARLIDGYSAGDGDRHGEHDDPTPNDPSVPTTAGAR